QAVQRRPVPLSGLRRRPVQGLQTASGPGGKVKSILAALAAVVAFFLALAIWSVGVYNGLVSLRENVNSSWAQVQNVYQRRADLVPNLVETVKGAASFEKSTLAA